MSEETKKIEEYKIYSYDVLGEFNNLYYKDLITENHCGEESFLLDSTGDKKFFYPLKYKRKTFALDSEKIKRLPIRVKESTKVGHRTNVYHWISSFSSAIIKGVKTKSMKELVFSFAPFEKLHSNPIHWTIYKLIVLTLLNEKGFVRAAAEAGFGKTSPFGILNPLTNKAVSINPRSAAAFEYRLIYPFINLDELSNLQKNQRDVMQDALLKVADWTSTYQKGTRGSKKFGTFDEMNTTETSIMITFNDTDSYKDSGQLDNFFDKIFQKAVLSRFFPVKFSGTLSADAFSEVEFPKQIAKDNYDYLIDIVKNIKYYKNNIKAELHNYKLPRVYTFEKTGRHYKTFKKIVMYIDAMCESQDEFNTYVETLYSCHQDYNKMIYDAFNFTSNEVRDIKNDTELTTVEKE